MNIKKELKDVNVGITVDYEQGTRFTVVRDSRGAEIAKVDNREDERFLLFHDKSRVLTEDEQEKVRDIVTKFAETPINEREKLEPSDFLAVIKERITDAFFKADGVDELQKLQRELQDTLLELDSRVVDEQDVEQLKYYVFDRITSHIQKIKELENSEEGRYYVYFVNDLGLYLTDNGMLTIDKNVDELLVVNVKNSKESDLEKDGYTAIKADRLTGRVE